MRSLNKGLFGGIFLIIIGVSLFIYSIVTLSEQRNLYESINFDDVDNNPRMSTSDKYYKHLAIADKLNIKLEKNKNILFKNTSCIYLDYAEHNTVSMYKLIFNSDRNDNTRRESVEGNVKNFSQMLDYYKICKQFAIYKVEMEKILGDIKKSNELHNNSSMTFDSFLNGSNQAKSTSESDFQRSTNEVEQTYEPKGEILLEDSYSGETDTQQNTPVIN